MTDIKLVLTDFDGTVAQLGKHLVSEKVREAVIACENRGIRMVPVTGRSYQMAQPVLEILGFEDLGVFDNGASIRKCKTGDLLWSQPIPAETVKRVAEILLPTAQLIGYEDDGNERVPAANELERITLRRSSSLHIYAVLPRKDIEVITRQLAEIADITFYTAASSYAHSDDSLGMQINHVHADKFHGVAALRTILNIPKEHTLAIGDGDNDIPLFKNAKHKIAMGNATELLKAEADHIVASVDNDGFAEAMHTHVLR